MLIILTYIVSIKKIFSKRSNTLKSFILWNKLFPLKKKGSNEFNVHTGFFIFLFFFLSLSYSLPLLLFVWVTLTDTPYDLHPTRTRPN